jgi:hypothetical protein
MEPRGTLFVIDDTTAEELLALTDDAAVVAAVTEELDFYQQQGLHEPVVDLGPAWDALQRCLSEGQLDRERDESELDRAILGGRQLHSGEHLVVSYKTPEQVKETARGVDWTTEAEFQEMYETLDPAMLAPFSLQRGWDYHWYTFSGLVEFYHFASKQGLAVVFTTITTPVVD